MPKDAQNMLTFMEQKEMQNIGVTDFWKQTWKKFRVLTIQALY